MSNERRTYRTLIQETGRFKLDPEQETTICQILRGTDLSLRLEDSSDEENCTLNLPILKGTQK